MIGRNKLASSPLERMKRQLELQKGLSGSNKRRLLLLSLVELRNFQLRNSTTRLARACQRVAKRAGQILLGAKQKWFRLCAAPNVLLLRNHFWLVACDKSFSARRRV